MQELPNKSVASRPSLVTVILVRQCHFALVLAVLLSGAAGCAPKSYKHRVALEKADMAEVRRLFRTPEDTQIKIQIGSHESSWVRPLHIAAQAGNVEVIDYLLSIGASPNSVCFQGKSPFFRVVNCKNEDDMKEVVALLCQYGGDINQKDNYGDTPLIRAVELDDAEFVGVLLEFGADSRIDNSDGETALDRARDRRLSAIEDMLMKHESAGDMKYRHKA